MPGKRTPATAPGTKRPSTLAKQHNLTAQEETEISEAFSLFSEPKKGHKHGVLPTTEVRSALVALGIPPSSRSEQAEFISILDPEDEGIVAYEDFFAICAHKYHVRRYDEDAEARERELDEAFALFTAGKRRPSVEAEAEAEIEGGGFLNEYDDDDHYDVDARGGKGKGKARVVAAPPRKVITLGDLRRVASLLKEEVSDELLRDMILEANGGAGVQVGVSKDDFQDVMRRAGAWR